VARSARKMRGAVDPSASPAFPAGGGPTGLIGSSGIHGSTACGAWPPRRRLPLWLWASARGTVGGGPCWPGARARGPGPLPSATAGPPGPAGGPKPTGPGRATKPHLWRPGPWGACTRALGRGPRPAPLRLGLTSTESGWAGPTGLGPAWMVPGSNPCILAPAAVSGAPEGNRALEFTACLWRGRPAYASSRAWEALGI
jgi:hypothetical protein